MPDTFGSFLTNIETDCVHIGRAIADQHGPELIAAGIPTDPARLAATAMITQSTRHMRSMLRGRGWTNRQQRRRLHLVAKASIVAGFTARYREMLSARGAVRS